MPTRSAPSLDRSFPPTAIVWPRPDSFRSCAHTLPEPCPEPPPPSRYSPGGIIEGSPRLQYRRRPPADRLHEVFARFDALNATDPNGKELLYAHRMTQWLD